MEQFQVQGCMAWQGSGWDSSASDYIALPLSSVSQLWLSVDPKFSSSVKSLLGPF